DEEYGGEQEREQSAADWVLDPLGGEHAGAPDGGEEHDEKEDGKDPFHGSAQRHRRDAADEKADAVEGDQSEEPEDAEVRLAGSPREEGREDEGTNKGGHAGEGQQRPRPVAFVEAAKGQGHEGQRREQKGVESPSKRPFRRGEVWGLHGECKDAPPVPARQD